MAGLIMPPASIPKPPDPAIAQQKAMAEASQEALRRRQQAKGFRSTVLTGQMMAPASASGLKPTLGS